MDLQLPSGLHLIGYCLTSTYDYYQIEHRETNHFGEDEVLETFYIKMCGDKMMNCYTFDHKNNYLRGKENRSRFLFPIYDDIKGLPLRLLFMPFVKSEEEVYVTHIQLEETCHLVSDALIKYGAELNRDVETDSELVIEIARIEFELYQVDMPEFLVEHIKERLIHNWKDANDFEEENVYVRNHL